MDNFNSVELAIFGLIQIWECALSWFTVEPVHKCQPDICHLHGLGATYPKHVFLLILKCKLFPIDLKTCMTLKNDIS